MPTATATAHHQERAQRIYVAGVDMKPPLTDAPAGDPEALKADLLVLVPTALERVNALTESERIANRAGAFRRIAAYREGAEGAGSTLAADRAALAADLATIAHEPGGVTRFGIHACSSPHEFCPSDPTGAPKRLLTQNSQLRKIGVFNFPLPSGPVRLPDGRTVNVCPSASACLDLCYARSGSYRFSTVLAAHMRNLVFILNRPDDWEEAMTRELSHKRYVGRHVRLHDSGEFFSVDYLLRWMRIMRRFPDVVFYCYTKEVALFREHVEPDPPANFKWRYSLGGRQDRLLDLTVDAHAEVFPDEDAVAARGYESNTSSDLVAAYGPVNVGMPANEIPHLKKKQAGETFGERQVRMDAERRERLGRAQAKASGPSLAV